MKKETIAIKIGGVAIGFRIGNARMISAIKKRYYGYIQKDKRPHLILNCTFSTKRVFSKSEKVLLKRKSDNHAWHAVRRDFECFWSRQNGILCMRPSIYSFDSCIRVLFATHMLLHKGILAHASAVCSGNRCVVFTGPSGSGKTTAVRLSGAKKVLNDEIVALTLNDRTVLEAWGTPFWGEMGSGPYYKKPYKVVAIYFLKKGDITKRIPVTKRDAVPRLSENICLFSKDQADIQLALETAVSITTAVPFYYLYFENRKFDIIY